MRIKKKTFYIVLPLSILVVLLLLLFVFLMGWFGNAPKLNRYGSLIETCEVEKKLFKVLVKCDVFINKTSQKDGKNCLDLTVVNKENTNILPLEVCEKEKVLDISDPVLDTDMKVPLHMVFEYTYLPPLSYGISHISMELMEDGEISTVVSGLSKEGMNIQNVRFQERVDWEKKGYYIQESEKFIEGMKIGIITFVHTKVKEISLDNNEILLDVSISINGVMRDTQIRVREFEYLTNRLPSEPKEITNENISEIDITKSHDLRFIYIPKNTSINKDVVNNYCSGNEIKWPAICYKKDNLEKYILDKPVDEYIEGSFEKLMFITFFRNE